MNLQLLVAHSFIELDKAVVPEIRWLGFCDCGFTVCPLMLSVTTYCLTGVSLTLDVEYLLTAFAPDLGRGVPPLGCSPLQHKSKYRLNI